VSVRPSVRLSVTRRYCVETAKRIDPVWAQRLPSDYPALCWKGIRVSPKRALQSETSSQTLNLAVTSIVNIGGRWVCLTNWRQWRSSVASLSHWAFTFVYNTMGGSWDLFMLPTFLILRPHRLNAGHRCGLLLQMSHVAWSVCLCACLSAVRVGHTGELWKTAEPIEMSRCRSDDKCRAVYVFWLAG